MGAESEFRAFQKRVENLYVEHPEITRIWNRLDRNRKNKKSIDESDDSPINLFIEGLPGSGKTQCTKKYRKRAISIRKYDEVEGLWYNTRPVLYMPLPIPFTYKGFYNNILRSIDPYFPTSNLDIDKIKHQAFSLLRKLEVEMLIIDEMDYLLASTYVQRKAVMENIKDIANSADVCLVCVGTHAIEELRTLNTQHLRRYPRTVLGHFKSCDESFLSFLKSLEEQLAPPAPIVLDWSSPDSAFAPTLFEITRGLVGWIKPIIREAMDLVGVFDENFKDFSILENIDGAVLLEAQLNVIGSFAEEDMAKIMEIEEGDQDNDESA
ncbi:TniB protein [Paenibacillus sp. BK033]|uniref:TniB family NTP-binding protein n=1 Tax=Paenibacillus sp. BK033 TaxID=2512133 RepID=UPI0010F20F10|nr:TniB family NTP-binding protein [Paenibacillus sp. BK033]TCM99450.1 TniB protein [Paenibacillus sp. BK033]